jgi:hypothetical protein
MSSANHHDWLVRHSLTKEWGYDLLCFHNWCRLAAVLETD